MKRILWVNPITDASAWYYFTDLRVINIAYGATAGELKQAVAEKLGLPADERQRLQLRGVSEIITAGARRKWRFNTEEIFRDNDDSSIYYTLEDLCSSGRIKCSSTIGVVILPADVEVVREVSAAEALEEQLAADRAKAIEIDGEAGADDGGIDDGHGNAPQPKRQRRAKIEGKNEEARTNDGGGNNGEEAADRPAPVPAAAGGDAIGGAAEEASVEAEEDTQPEDVNPLRLWLRNLDQVDGSRVAPGRYEQYAEAFEREFGSLQALARASAVPDGMAEILQTCGVRALGDKAEIRHAIRELPGSK